MGRKITMQDLAREAGCSKSQVSRALNGLAEVSPEIRQRVLDAAIKADYRNLARNHVPTIALIIQQKADYFVMPMMEACLVEAERRNWGCQVIDSRQCAQLKEFFFDGAISTLFDQSWPRQWGTARSMPLVVINSYGFRPDHICSIDPDPLSEAMLVLSHLHGLGHRRIARIHIENPGQTYHRGGREFMRAAAALDLSGGVENLETTEPLSVAMLQGLIDRGFTAFFVIHQYLAVPAAQMLAATGKKIPGEISLVTYEVPSISPYLSPPHTTVNFDYAQMARLACDQLALRMGGKDAAVGDSFRVPAQLVIRGTTGAVFLQN